MELTSSNLHTKNLIYKDVDKYSEELNLHKVFLNDNSIKKTYYCLTLYFEDTNPKEYFKEFVNNILKLLDNDDLEELTFNLEKSVGYHIHVAVMFNKQHHIYSKLNKIYNNINIESISCSNYDKVKQYCSKDFSRVKDTQPIYWKKETGLIVAQISKNEAIAKTFDSDIKLNVLSKGIAKHYKDLFEFHAKRCLRKQIVYGYDEMMEDFQKIKNGEEPSFAKEKVEGDSDEKYKKIIDELKNTISVKSDIIENLKEKSYEFQHEIQNLNSTMYRFNKSENEYVKTIKELQKEIIDLKTKTQQDSICNILENKIKELNNKVNEKELDVPKEKKDMKTDFDKQFTYEELEEKFSDAECLVLDKNFEISELTEQLTALTLKYNNLLSKTPTQPQTQTQQQPKSQTQIIRKSRSKNSQNDSTYIALLEKYEKLVDKHAADVEKITLNHSKDIENLNNKYMEKIENINNKYSEKLENSQSSYHKAIQKCEDLEKEYNVLKLLCDNNIKELNVVKFENQGYRIKHGVLVVE